MNLYRVVGQPRHVIDKHGRMTLHTDSILVRAADASEALRESKVKPRGATCELVRARVLITRIDP